jgi:hypothetical protein
MFQDFHTGKIECAFCGEVFKDFGPLAEHVQTVCGPDSARRKARDEQMLPAPAQGRAANTQTRTGKRPWLKIADLSGTKHEVTIKKFINERNEYNDAIMIVDFDGTEFNMGIKFRTTNFEKLYAAFGADETKWAGQKFYIFPEYSESREDHVIGVEAEPQAKAREPKSRK